MPAHPPRRSLLAATALTLPLLATGCKGVGALGTPPVPLPDVALLRGTISAEQLMIDRYRSALAAAPGLAATLTPLLGQHQQHLTRMRAMLIEPAGATAQPTGSPTASPAAGSPSAVLASLVAAENQAASALISHLSVASPALAQLLASVAACEASHALLLRLHQAGSHGAHSAGPASPPPGPGGQVAG